MKNVSLLEINDSYKLFQSDGYPFDPFTQYVSYIEGKEKSPSTVKSYANHVAHFIDYLFEAGVFGEELPVSFDVVNHFIDQYPKVLSKASDHNDSVLSKIARNLERSPIAKESVSIHVAAINGFLELSESIAREISELTKLYVGKRLDSDNYVSVLNAIQHRSKISENEKVRIRQNSMLAGVVRKLPKSQQHFKSRNGLKAKQSRVPNPNHAKDFPLSDIINLIESANSYRDKALYSLCAGRGLRQSEALSIQIDDINASNRSVSIFDPDGLRNIDRLIKKNNNKFKGRNTSKVFFFEPLKTLLFENLENYIRYERISTNDHSFLFQYLDSPGNSQRAGLPLLNATNTALNNSFRIAQRNIGIDPIYTLHSLRHLYGVYMLNYIPTPYGNGLRLDEVQVLMGHESIQSTQVYARAKEEVIEAKLQYADLLLLGQMDNFNQLPTLIADQYRSLASKIEGAV